MADGSKSMRGVWALNVVFPALLSQVEIPVNALKRQQHARLGLHALKP